MSAGVDMLELIKREWLKNTPEETIRRMSGLKRGELLRAVASLGLPTARDATRFEKHSRQSPKEAPRLQRQPAPKLLALSKLERIKDAVKRLKGRLTVTAYLPDSRDYFKIEYNADQDKGVYAKYTACEGDQRETVEEYWPSRMYDVFNTSRIVACVEFEGCGAEWFDSGEEPTAMERMYRFIVENSTAKTR